jgi:hypothetical protein
MSEIMEAIISPRAPDILASEVEDENVCLSYRKL